MAQPPADPESAAIALHGLAGLHEELSMRRHLGLTLIVLALAAAVGEAEAQPVERPPVERLLSVVGEGTVRGRPDMAVIVMGVVSEAKAARQALDGNSAAMTRIVEALKGQGLESRDLQTANFSVEAVYSQPPPGFDGSQPFEPRIIAYRVRNELTLRIRDLARTGALLDEVITLGANSVSGPTFTVADPTPLEDQARRAAMRDAVRKGELYAQAAAIRLGPIARIDESGRMSQQPLPMAAMAREAAADSAVPVEAGELTFQAQVAVSWEIAP
jgi:uncharacterized protein YggE